MKLMKAVGREVPCFRGLDAFQELVVGGVLFQDLGRDKQTRAFAAKPAVASGRINRAFEKIVKIVDADELLGHLHELRIVIQDALDERNTERPLSGRRKLHTLGNEMAIPFDSAGDFDQGRVRIFQDLDQESGPVFLNPFLYKCQDFGFAQMLLRKLENVLARREKILGCRHPQRTVVILALLRIRRFSGSG